MSAGDRDHADGTPRRFADCANLNPANDDYHPNCCRFPKSCSPYPYAETPVTDADLEPRRGAAARQVSTSAGDRDTLAELIRRHEFWAGLGSCSCGYDCEPFDDGHEGEERAHRAHLADVLLASDWLTGAKAGAWDEGFRAGYGRDGAADNPYRVAVR